MQNYVVNPGGYLRGEFTMPGDKSISHRSIIFGAIAEGITHVSGFLQGADCLATMQAFRTMGVKITDPVNGNLTINGVGLNGLRAPDSIIDLGNSGTSIRLLMGLLAGQNFSSVLTGDASLCKRPMARMAKPLREMGAEISMRDDNFPPVNIIGHKKLRAINYVMPVASAQVKSGLLLAGLYANGITMISEPAPTRDHTERLLGTFGCQVERKANQIILTKPSHLKATNLSVPADISSAAFFMVGAAIAPGSEVILKNIGINPTRTGIINILQLMGADIQLFNQCKLGEEPVADIKIKYSKLKGIHIPKELVPLAIDEFPAIFIAAACAKGTTVLTGAEELRIKESDRIQVMADGLTAVGITVQVTSDGIIISGEKIRGGIVNSHGDHRIAMSFAMAGLAASEEIIIQDCKNVDTSFPGFAELAQQAGLDIITEN